MAKKRKAEGYEVGFGKPPKEHQFQPGQSGNPKGRPSGSRNARTMLRELLHEQITITENGRKRTVTKLEAAFMRLINSALSGNTQSMRLLTGLLPMTEEGDVAAEEPSLTLEEEEAYLKRLIEKHR